MEISDLQIRNGRIEEKRERLSRDCHRWRDQARRLQSEKHQLNEDLGEAKSELKSAKAGIHRLRNANRRLERKRHALEIRVLLSEGNRSQKGRKFDTISSDSREGDPSESEEKRIKEETGDSSKGNMGVRVA
jgi:peptidoglycan hydrolase CwlO-like protein